MAPFCGLCGDHLHLRDAKPLNPWLRFWESPSRVEQIDQDHACERCNTAIAPHLSRFAKNSDALAARRSSYVFPCRQDNAECYEWHHATQDRCDCACHELRSAWWREHAWP